MSFAKEAKTYSEVVLETLGEMEAATALYRALGFRQISTRQIGTGAKAFKLIRFARGLDQPLIQTVSSTANTEASRGLAGIFPGTTVCEPLHDARFLACRTQTIWPRYSLVFTAS